MSIYRRMIDAHVRVEHHESDLYVPFTEQTRALLADYDGVVGCFVGTDGRLWFDVAFAYDPWWEVRCA